MPKKATPQDWTEVPKSVNLPLSDDERKVCFIVLRSGYAQTVSEYARKAMASKAEELGAIKTRVEEVFQELLRQKEGNDLNYSED